MTMLTGKAVMLILCQAYLHRKVQRLSVMEYIYGEIPYVEVLNILTGNAVDEDIV
jgi:hypothetical protein